MPKIAQNCPKLLKIIQNCPKLTKLAQIVEAGGMRPVLDEQDFSLEEAAKAHDRLASGQAMGKVVISVQ